MKEWKVLARRIVYSARPYVEVARETVQLPDGRVVDDYHQIESGAFSTIVPQTQDGRFLLLRQYRHGVRRVALTLPGGRIDDGESPLEAARRELLEETGYAASEWRSLASYDASCTYGFARNHYFHAVGVTWRQPPADDDLEQSSIEFLDRKSAVEMLLSGGFASTGHALPLALFLLSESGR